MQDDHAKIIATDIAHDQGQVAYEVGQADASIENMFEVLITRLDEAGVQLELIRNRVNLKRDEYRQARDAMKDYANGTLEQLGAFGLLMAKVSDVADGIPTPAALADFVEKGSNVRK